jgi:hypothetical protein
MRKILYTRHDGGVAVCTPAAECLAWMSCGGYWNGRGIDLDEQIERAVAAGHSERAARRFVRAMDVGGCTTAEAYDIIRDRDCGHLGTAFELVDALPDRWFRDAWRRGHNGGPIDVDIEAARAIQWRRVVAATRAHDREQQLDLSVDLTMPMVALGALRDKILLADDLTELRNIWPHAIPLTSSNH